MNKSVWTRGLTYRKCRKLNKDIETDYLIIGGGIAGISVLENLMDKDVVLIDKGVCGFGVSSKTTGKLTSLQGSIMNNLLYYQSAVDAINIVRNNVSKYNIECDLEASPSYLFSFTENLYKEIKFYKDNNIDASLTNNFIFPNAIKLENNFVFHPLKYICAIKNMCLQKGIKIYENTTSHSISKKDGKYIVDTGKYHIISKNVIVCSHYPSFIIPGNIPFITSLEKSFVLSCPSKNINNFNAISIDEPIRSIRYYKNNLIFAGHSIRLSKNLNINKDINNMKDDLKNLFGLNPKYIWSTHDVITNDHLPLIGKIDDNLYIATGFNKWGMTNGVISGKVISDIINNISNPYIDLFNPKRKIKSYSKLLYNWLDTSRIFLKTKIIKNYSFYKSVVIKNGYGIYTDSNNIKHVVKNKCPHMGCSLIFNNFDKTWDCPCHGSRFDVDGLVIEGPSTYNISVHKKN
ncbi:MAG: FAD-dependent oxidoreductase [Bacilli bacterium]